MLSVIDGSGEGEAEGVFIGGESGEIFDGEPTISLSFRGSLKRVLIDVDLAGLAGKESNRLNVICLSRFNFSCDTGVDIPICFLAFQRVFDLEAVGESQARRRKVNCSGLASALWNSGRWE